MKARYAALLMLTAVMACRREVAKYPIPPEAKALPNGDRYVILRAGDGRPAETGGIWDVQWALMSHSTPGCPYPCTSGMLLPASHAQYAADRSWLSTMREREVRRVWRTVDGQERVFEVEMASVVRTDASGEPEYMAPLRPTGRAREVAKNLFVEQLRVPNPGGAAIESGRVFLFIETVYDKEGRDVATSVPSTSWSLLPEASRTELQGMSVGERRRIWRCASEAGNPCTVEDVEMTDL